MKWESADLRVGLLLVAAAAVGLGSFVWLTPAVSDDTLPYYADFPSVDGLGPQSEVQIAGFQVGRVAEITPLADPVSRRITFRVRMQLRPRIGGSQLLRLPQGTVARIVSGGIISGAVVALEFPLKSTGYLKSGDVLTGAVALGINDQIKQLAEGLGDDVKKTLKATTKLVDSLQLVAHDARGAIGGVTDLTREGREALPVLLANVNRDLNSVDSLVNELRTISPALKVSLDSVNLLVSDTRKTINTVNGMMKDREPEVARIAANLDSTAVMLRWFVEQVARRPMRAITGVTIPILSPRDFQDAKTTDAKAGDAKPAEAKPAAPTAAPKPADNKPTAPAATPAKPPLR